MNVREKLLIVQGKLNAPKSQINKFGGYKYRSNEDILNAVKPLLSEVKVIITQNDEIVQVGERYYIKVTSNFIDVESPDKDINVISNTAYAREAESKKGMDESQITGAASSYARKYSLNGLLAIDDSKDPDTTNKHGEENNEQEKEINLLSLDQVTEVQDEIDRRQGIDVPKMLQWCTKAWGYPVAEIADIRQKNYKAIMTMIQKKPFKNA